MKLDWFKGSINQTQKKDKGQQIDLGCVREEGWHTKQSMYYCIIN
jgi:hypothetical protein